MYCKNCGRQIGDNAEICPGCGVRIKNLSIVTLLNQVGVPGFRSGKKWNMVIATLIYISIFLLIASGLGNIDNMFLEDNQSQMPPQITPQINQKVAPVIPVATRQKDVIRPQVTIQNKNNNDNNRFSEFTNSMEVLRADVEQLNTAISSNDYDSIESYGKTLREDSEKYIELAQQFSVTSDIKEVFGEYNNTLQYFYLSGKYAEQGGKNKDPNDINTSSQYIEKARVQAIKMRDMAPSIDVNLDKKTQNRN